MRDEVLQLSLFDERDLSEIRSPDYSGERLIACRNPFLAEERARKREALLLAAERELDAIVAAPGRPRRPLRGQHAIRVRVDKVLGRFKVGKHLEYEITDRTFTRRRNQEQIEGEADLDGIYVIRTGVPRRRLDAEQAVEICKDLSRIERAFRCLKTVDLEVRPIHHRRFERAWAHVLVCVLAYYVLWHMKNALAPILFQDDDPAASRRRPASLVARARRSEQPERKASTGRTPTGEPVHDFHSLMDDLATLARNRSCVRGIEHGTLI